MDTAVRHMSQTPRREVLTSQYGPSVAALFYPLALFALHESGKQLLQATYAGGKLAAGVAMGLAVCLVYSVPVLSFAVILRSTADVRSRRLAHLAFASPPMFVLIGVLFYMLGLPNGDYLVWTLGWLGVLAFARVARPANRMAAPAATWVRFGHGISAALIIAFFLAWHLGNHLTAAWSLDTDKQVMDALRTWYRSSAVQPILIALFAFQLLSGLRLYGQRSHVRPIFTQRLRPQPAPFLWCILCRTSSPFSFSGGYSRELIPRSPGPRERRLVCCSIRGMCA